MGAQLEWGKRYLMVDPEHFRIDYAINPFMDTAVQPDPVRARSQARALATAIETAGGTVSWLAQRGDSPDMVYAMNLGLVVGERVVMSHMRYAERRAEAFSAAPWFVEHGFAPTYVGRDGVGAHLEAGDAFPWRGDLVVGHGPRTEELALKHLATELGVRVHGVRIVHEAMYHLDLAFCPLDSEHAMIAPSAFDDASARALLDLVPQPLVLTEAEALTFVANSVVVGRTVIAPACPDRVRRALEARGFEVVVVDVGEFLLGGGAVRCLTNPLDVLPGRDLTAVPGGRVTAAVAGLESPT